MGLMFYGVILLWLLFAIFMASKLPKWLNIKRYSNLWATAFGVLIFFLPVGDEVIAYPQIQSLCQGVDDYQFVPGMSAAKAQGRQIYHASREGAVWGVFPSTVEIKRHEQWYRDAITKEDILYRFSISVKHGWLHMPAGSSGDFMPLLSKGCSPKQVLHDSKGVPLALSNANVTKTESVD